MSEKRYVSRKTYKEIINSAISRKKTLFREIFNRENIISAELEVKLGQKTLSNESVKNIMIKAGGELEPKKAVKQKVGLINLLLTRDNRFLISILIGHYITKVNPETLEIIEAEI